MIEYLWIENRGMSIITAVFFMGIFSFLSIMIWWIIREIGRLDKKIIESSVHVDSIQNKLIKMNTDIEVIRTTLSKMDQLLERVAEKIYR